MSVAPAKNATLKISAPRHPGRHMRTKFQRKCPAFLTNVTVLVPLVVVVMTITSSSSRARKEGLHPLHSYVTSPPYALCFSWLRLTVVLVAIHF
jgi:hypothetical protein